VQFSLYCPMKWKEFIQKYTVDQIMRALPYISPRLPYAWRSGEREPPKYAQGALMHWLEQAEQDGGANGDKSES